MKDDFEIIDDKYIIIYNIEKGYCSDIYLVIDNNNNCKYVAKIVKIDTFNKEKEINEKINQLEISNIIKLIYSNENGIKKKRDGKKESIKYFIFEYQEKRDLLRYAIYGKCEEKKCIKFYFKKILEIVQEIHQNGIFHLDIKLQNILVKDNYEPILSDFGLSEKLENSKNGKLLDNRGTPGFTSPQIDERLEYDGIQTDIYSLGISLFQLVVGILPFENSSKRKEFYDIIKKNKEKKIKAFWNNIKKRYHISLSENFKKLFTRMVSYEEKDRPSIKNILEDQWFEEVKNLTFNDIENQLRAVFSHKEYFIKENLRLDNPKNSASTIAQESLKTEMEEKTYFEEGIKIKKERPEINMDAYLRINEITDIVDFMNSLANKYKNGFCDSIEESKKNLKFNAIFDKKTDNKENSVKNDNSEENYNEDDDEENEDDDEENEDDEGDDGDDDGDDDEDFDEDDVLYDVQKKLIIQAKIFKGINGGYILSFKKKEGELLDFYKYVLNCLKKAEKLIYDFKNQ